MFPKTFGEMGIPSGYGFKQLLFSPVANALVVQACSGTNGWRPERLYFRHWGWDRYRPIGIPDDLVPQESPFIHPSRPLLAFVSMQHKFSIDGEGKEFHSGDWHSLRIVSLETGYEIQSVDEETIVFPSGISRGWICEIVAFGESGLFVKAALSRDETLIEYFIAELNEARALKPIVALPAVFM
jgi:hypothetical protein